MHTSRHDTITILRAVALLALAAPATSPAHLRAAEISVTYRFDDPVIIEMERGFSRIEFPSTIQGGRPGEPSYPFRGAAILLPPGEAAAGVRIVRRGWTQLESVHRLHPMQYPVPGIESDRRDRVFLFEEDAYRADRWVIPPDSKFRTQYCNGHSIAVGAFSPVGYHPLNGTIGYYREVSVIIESAAGAASIRSCDLLRTDGATHSRIAAFVDNPADLALYGGAERSALGTAGDGYELMIITRESLCDAFIPLRDYHTRRGTRARIWTVEMIEQTFMGYDTAERIRNAVISEYTNSGITHVLLGGDANGPPEDPKTVPARGLYCAVQSHPSLYEDDNIPADLYFAALDGDWNDDGDGLWGEPGEEDFYSEVAVGRACVETPDEVATFINKTVIYQDAPVAGQVRRALLLGEKLWNDPLTYGGDEMDQLVGTCTAHGFTTTGIPTEFDTTRRYDRDGPPWPKSAVWTEINAGTHWMNHAGHCNWNYALRLYLGDITDANFTNDGVSANFAIINSQGCYTMSFDNRSSSGAYQSDDCIGEEMMKLEHCAVAFFGNSRYGWFTEGTTNGPSHHFQRELFDAVFTEGYHTLGGADQRSKDETVPFIDLPGEYEPGANRWCFYTLNLFGDPALDAWTDSPQPLGVVHPAMMGRHDGTIELQTPGVAGAVAALYHEGVCFGRGVGSPAGEITLQRTRPLPDSISAIELDVTAHDHYTYRDTISIDETTDAGDMPSLVSLSQNVPNPFNPSTVIRFSLDRERFVDLSIYDAAGRRIDRIVHGTLPPGAHAVTWRPAGLASGVYLYALSTDGRRLSRKALLLK